MERRIRWCWIFLLLAVVACGTDPEVLEDTKRLESFKTWNWEFAGTSVARVESDRNTPLGAEGTILEGSGYWTLPQGTDQIEVVQELERHGLALTFVSCGPLLRFGGNVDGFETSLRVSGQFQDGQLVVIVSLPPRSRRGSVGANQEQVIDGPLECQTDLDAGLGGPG